MAARKITFRKSQSMDNLSLFLMIVPGLLYLLINNYLPMAGMIIAFKDVNYTKGILGSAWVGLKNFEFLFKTADAFVITRNTLLYNSFFILINLVVALTIAILLNEVSKKYAARFFQSAVLLPHLLSWVIVGYLSFSFLSEDNGFLNKTLLPFLGMKEVSWYGSPSSWPVILTLVNIWKSVGYLSVIYFAAIIGIDNEMYEAAEIDGAGKFKQVWSITLPSVLPVLVTMTLLQVGRIFYADFGLFYQVPMDSGALYPTTNVIDTYVYRALMNIGDIGMSSAAGFYQSLVGFALIMASNWAVKRIDPENALF